MTKIATLLMISALLLAFIPAITGCQSEPQPQQRHQDPAGQPAEPAQPPLPDQDQADDNAQQAESEMLQGHVRYQDIEGGFYGLVDAQGNRYNPLNLPEEYKVDGMAVRFRVKERPDAITIRMWGKNVEVIEIEQIKSQ